MIDNGWFGGNTLSGLMGTCLERVVGNEVFEFYRLQFPVIVKVIDVKAWQPLQMNASDDVAAERYDSFGKTAFWYVQEAAPEAELPLGFNRDIDPAEFYARCQDGTVKEVLNIVKPQKGEAFLIKPGTVFAAGPGLKIVEVAESSELVFNLHNWGMELLDSEELLLEEAFNLIDFKKYIPESVTGDKLASCPEFVVTKLNLKEGLHMFSDQPGGFAVYYCASGEAPVEAFFLRRGPGAGCPTKKDRRAMEEVRDEIDYSNDLGGIPDDIAAHFGLTDDDDLWRHFSVRAA